MGYFNCWLICITYSYTLYLSPFPSPFSLQKSRGDFLSFLLFCFLSFLCLLQYWVSMGSRRLKLYTSTSNVGISYLRIYVQYFMYGLVFPPFMLYKIMLSSYFMCGTFIFTPYQEKLMCLRL